MPYINRFSNRSGFLGLALLLCGCSTEKEATTTGVGSNRPHANAAAGSGGVGIAGAPNQFVDGGAGTANDAAGAGAPNQVAASTAGASATAAAGQGGVAGLDVVNPCTPAEAAALAIPKTFTADDPRFQYIGRVDKTIPTQPIYGAAAVTVQAKFRGSSLTIRLHDEFKNARNYYDILIDSQLIERFAPTQTAKDVYPIDPTTVPTMTPLACGDHTLKIVKRTQAGIGNTTFLGIDVGDLLQPDPLPTRKVEVIGDSITCGEGVQPFGMGNGSCSQDSSWGQPTHNARLAWGWRLGELLKAQVYNTCVSGIGLMRNYEIDADAIPMPQAYVKTVPVSRNSAAWDTAQNWVGPGLTPAYVPDAIVIALGTNDFSPGKTSAPDYRPMMDPQVFAQAYIAFITQLLGYYPSAKIYFTDSQILSDGYPNSSFHSKSDFERSLSLLDDYYATAGDGRVKKALGGDQRAYNNGCNGHTQVKGQYAAAENIAKVVGPDMGWQ